jgi:trypsin
MNRKILTRAVQIIAFIALIGVLFYSCESNPVEQEMTTRSTEFHTMAPGELPQPMIVGGEEVDPACPNCKYDFMVSLQQGGHFCGGSLVREDWVVTAAHCVQGNNNGLQVKIGLHNVNGTAGSITRNVDQVIVHPQYSGWSLNNDYALLHLSQPVTNFEPIKLCTDTAHDEEPVMATTMGWGATQSGGWGSNILLEVDVPIDDSCGNYSNSDITNNMVCAGYSGGGYDSCQGDSGGPLIMTNSDGEYELIGIVSWGYGCAEPGYPGVYSKIHSRLDWFFQYIGEPEDEFEVELYGDVNFDGNLNVTDVITLINFVLGQTPTEEELLTGDVNQDGILNILDVIQLVGEILGTSFAQSVEWLEEHFPELKTKERLSKLDKSQFFSKKNNCVQLEKELDVVLKQYEKLLEENKNLKLKLVLLTRLDEEKMKMLQELREITRTMEK